MYNNGITLFHKRSTFYFLGAGTCIMIVVMFITGKPLNTPETASGILNLEFSNTHQKVQQVLSSWKDFSTPDHNIITSAKINTWLDFIFLFFYSCFLYSCCIKLSIVLQQCGGVVKWLNFFAVVALFVGVLDIFENIGMLISLSGNVSENVAIITSTISIIKWLLVASVILSIIFTLAIKIIYKKNDTG